MSNGLEDVRTIASDEEFDRESARELNTSPENLTLEERKVATEEVIKVMVFMKDKAEEARDNIKDLSSLETLSGEDGEKILDNIGMLIASEEKVNELSGKAVVLNHRLIFSVVKNFSNTVKGVDMEDLFQEGFIGAWKSFKEYNPNREPKCEYSTYITNGAKWEIYRYLYNNSKIRLPQNVSQEILDYNKEKNSGRSDLVTDEEIVLRKFFPDSYNMYKTQGDLLDETHSVREFLLQNPELGQKVFKKLFKIGRLSNMSDVAELDAPRYVASVNNSGERIPRDRVTTLAETYMTSLQGDRPVEDIVGRGALLQNKIAEILDTALNDREKNILKLRVGLADGKEHTLGELANYFNLTRERIRQIEVKALRKLRHPKISKQLKGSL